MRRLTPYLLLAVLLLGTGLGIGLGLSEAPVQPGRGTAVSGVLPSLTAAEYPVATTSRFGVQELVGDVGVPRPGAAAEARFGGKLQVGC